MKIKIQMDYQLSNFIHEKWIDKRKKREKEHSNEISSFSPP